MRWAWLTVLLSCHSAEFLHLPAPQLSDEVQSVVFAFDGEQSFLYAVDRDDGSLEVLLAAPGWTTSEGMEAIAFLYPQPLAAYRLVPGLITVEPDNTRACALDQPLAALSYETTERTWTETSIEHPLLRTVVDRGEVGCTAARLCRTFLPEHFDLLTNEDAMVLFPLDAETAWVGTDDGHVYEVTRTSITHRDDLTGLPGGAGTIDADGDIWLGGKEGRIVRGRRDAPFVEVRSGPVDATVRAIGVRGSGDDREVISVSRFAKLEGAVTSTVTIERFFRGTWTELYRGQLFNVRAAQSQVFFQGKQALACYGGTSLFIIEGEDIEEVAVEPANALLNFTINSFTSPDGERVFMGSGDSLIYEAEPGFKVWTPVPSTTIGTGVEGIGTAYGGIILGGPDGRIGQHYFDADPCDAARVGHADVERILQLGSAVLVTGGNPNRARPNRVTWLVP